MINCKEFEILRKLSPTRLVILIGPLVIGACTPILLLQLLNSHTFNYSLASNIYTHMRYTRLIENESKKNQAMYKNYKINLNTWLILRFGWLKLHEKIRWIFLFQLHEKIQCSLSTKCYFNWSKIVQIFAYNLNCLNLKFKGRDWLLVHIYTLSCSHRNHFMKRNIYFFASLNKPPTLKLLHISSHKNISLHL